MTGAPGELALVLHTHLPWVTDHGVWPVGEEWLFQAWGHSWLPVTEVLLQLAEDGHTDVLTLGVTPMVAAQLSDPRLVRDLGTWLGGQMWRAEEQRWHWWLREEVQALSHHHWTHHQQLLALHEEVTAAGGLLAVWADLADRGVIELLGGPATHPYLPLLTDEAAVDAQLGTGLSMHERWAGRPPTGIWPPELAYRPGLDDAYARHGLTHVLADAATVIRAAGGAERDWDAKPLVAGPADEAVFDGALIGESEVAVFARDLSVRRRVWADGTGYPGDAWYRDFHTQGTFGAHRSHRVTGQHVHWRDKEPYGPAHAAARTAVHADDFVGLLHELLDPRPGRVVVAAFDTELFGHWWYEGPRWLERVLRGVEGDAGLRTTTLASRRARRPPTRRLTLPESSWGHGRDHRTWRAPSTRGMWRRITTAEERATAAVAAAGADADAAVVAQLARELAQLRCSDWPFMVTRGNTAEYGRQRVTEHADAAERLCWLLESGTHDPAFVASRRARVPVPEDTRMLAAALRDGRTAGTIA